MAASFIERDFVEVRDWLVVIFDDEAPAVRILDSAIESGQSEYQRRQRRSRGGSFVLAIYARTVRSQCTVLSRCSLA